MTRTEVENPRVDLCGWSVIKNVKLYIVLLRRSSSFHPFLYFLKLIFNFSVRFASPNYSLFVGDNDAEEAKVFAIRNPKVPLLLFLLAADQRLQTDLGTSPIPLYRNGQYYCLLCIHCCLYGDFHHQRISIPLGNQ